MMWYRHKYGCLVPVPVPLDIKCLALSLVFCHCSWVSPSKDTLSPLPFSLLFSLFLSPSFFFTFYSLLPFSRLPSTFPFPSSLTLFPLYPHLTPSLDHVHSIIFLSLSLVPTLSSHSHTLTPCINEPSHVVNLGLSLHILFSLLRTNHYHHHPAHSPTPTHLSLTTALSMVLFTSPITL